MSDSKLLKILYGIICLMLALFFGFGVYFLLHQSYGAGLLAIGIGLIGLGFALFLGAGFLFAKDVVSETVYSEKISGKAVLSGGVRLKDILFHMNGIVNGRSADIAVADVGFSVAFPDGTIYAMSDDIRGVMLLPDGNGMIVRGNFEQKMQLRDMVLRMKVENKMRMKAMEKMLVNAGVIFVENEAALGNLTCDSGVKVGAGRRKLSDVVRES